ncbi:MAG: hypothetical protein AABY01_02410 [Nanoarchaeota archaeon]
MTCTGVTTTYLIGDHLQLKRKARTVPKTEQNPAGILFAVVGQARLRDQFRDVIRIDNYPHHDMGTHVHVNGRVLHLPEIVDPNRAMEYVEHYLKQKYPELV